MNSGKILRQLLIFVLVALTLSQTANAAFTVSGSISLPTGVVAGSEGVEIRLNGLFREFPSGSDTTTARIGQGQSSAPYSLTFSGDDDQEIEFECTVGCFDLGVTTEGAWNENDGIVPSFGGTDFSRTMDHLVNIRLETATRFSGQMRLPEGFTATGNELLLLRISSNDRFAFLSFSDGVVLSPGEDSFNFEIGIPSDETNQSWSVEFSCFACDDDILGDDTYASTISGDPAVTDEDLAFAFPMSGNFNNLTLTLISIALDPVQSKISIAPILLLLDD